MLKGANIAKIKEVLKTEVFKPSCNRGGGCINEAVVFETDTGSVFVKYNSKEDESKDKISVKEMFDGEAASLQKIAATETVKAPEPITVVELENGAAALVMENLNITGGLRKDSAELGRQLARLHLKNKEVFELNKKGEKFVHKKTEVVAVTQFGFDVTTCCGYLPQDNTWTESWESFYARKIESQISLIRRLYSQKEAKDASELWDQVTKKLPKFFEDIEIFPALLHGDLWTGNAAETPDGPVVFDPASFYGHAEYDLAISCMFGGFPGKFFDAYYQLLPKEKNYEKRLELYKLFHYLNHWNHFGHSYSTPSILILNSLIKMDFST